MVIEVRGKGGGVGGWKWAKGHKWKVERAFTLGGERRVQCGWCVTELYTQNL